MPTRCVDASCHVLPPGPVGGAHARPTPARPDTPHALVDHNHLGQAAVSALLAEVLLTPKPALVDQRGSGAHRDLDLDRMIRSAWSLAPTFVALARAADGARPSQLLREQLARLGRQGERTMLAATAGSNTHRGAIWIIGLLVAGAAMLGSAALGSDEGAVRSSELAAQLAAFPDRFAPRRASNGSRVTDRYGVRGARGEALDGFPHARHIGLPALHAARAAGATETDARLDALLAIMATLDDTCVLHRGGRAALQAAQDGAEHVLQAGGAGTPAGRTALLALDRTLVSLNASPGGAADLLAATLFLDTLARAPRVS